MRSTLALRVVPFLFRCLTMSCIFAAALYVAPSALAQLGARTTEQWLKTLDSQNRVAKLKVDEVVAALKLKPDRVVADIGGGAGEFTLPLAKVVAGSGKPASNNCSR